MVCLVSSIYTFSMAMPMLQFLVFREASWHALHSIMVTWRKIDQQYCVLHHHSHYRAMSTDNIVFTDEVDARQFEEAVVGKKVVAAKRKGKQLWLDFDGGQSALFHFGMTGSFAVQGVKGVDFVEFKVDATSQWPPRFCKCELAFDDGLRVAFCDPRRLARIRLREDPVGTPPISLLAPDPLVDGLDDATVFAALSETSAPLKGSSGDCRFGVSRHLILEGSMALLQPMIR